MRVFYNSPIIRVRICIDVPAKTDMNDPLTQRDSVLIEMNENCRSVEEVLTHLDDFKTRFLSLPIED